MNDDGLDEARKDLALARQRLENTLALLELAPAPEGVRESEARAKVLTGIKEALQSVDALALTVGDVPVTLRH